MLREAQMPREYCEARRREPAQRTRGPHAVARRHAAARCGPDPTSRCRELRGPLVTECLQVTTGLRVQLPDLRERQTRASSCCPPPTRDAIGTTDFAWRRGRPW